MSRNITLKVREELIGIQGSEYYKGEKGNNGWLPLVVVEEYGEKLLHKIADYVGGTGTKPTSHIGWYYSEAGLVEDKELASNFKGKKGDKGEQGDITSIVGTKTYNDITL